MVPVNTTVNITASTPDNASVARTIPTTGQYNITSSTSEGDDLPFTKSRIIKAAVDDMPDSPAPPSGITEPKRSDSILRRVRTDSKLTFAENLRYVALNVYGISLPAEAVVTGDSTNGSGARKRVASTGPRRDGDVRPCPGIKTDVEEKKRRRLDVRKTTPAKKSRVQPGDHVGTTVRDDQRTVRRSVRQQAIKRDGKVTFK